MKIINLLLIILWMIIIPTAAGACFVRKNKRFSLINAFICGHAYMLALAEALALLMLVAGQPLHVLCILYGGVLALTAVLGFGLYAGNAGQWEEKEKTEWKKAVILLLAAAMMAALTVFVAVFAHYDADDGFYVATAVTEKFTDTIFKINPYTGNPYYNLPSRYVLSQNPTFLAMMSILCGGMHPAAMAHIGLPLAYIPLAFSVWYMLSRHFFPRDYDMQGTFLILCIVFTWFSGYSRFNSSVFLLGRVWQGKGSLAGIWLPMLFYMGLEILADKKTELYGINLFMGVCGACLLSSMGVILAPVIVGTLTLYGTAANKSFRRFLMGAAAVSPAVILGITYLMIR
ncbi:MAG: hypothetical protein IJ123_06805 [Blautia sp.]|nr:hypothetical protein [Blautia sp.]